VVGSIYLSGQFTPEDLAAIQAAGVKRVISLRNTSELEWDEKQVVEDLELEFQAVPFQKPETLNDGVFDQICILLKDTSGKTLLHCGSADRVGGVWIAHRVLNDGIPLEQARKEAVEIGLLNAEYEAKAVDYVNRKLAERSRPQSTIGEDSVSPGINDKFLDPELDPNDWVKRFEIESREIYQARKAIVGACEINSGARIADVGAGTGVFTRQFSELAGPKGWVFAVDISPRLVEHINRESTRLKQENVTGVLCREDSVCLPPNSIDVAFICDTYHHFEFPHSTMASIHRALSEKGKLVLIDFERIPGKSREWTLSHVRADKQTFQKEIEEAGFEKVSEALVPGLSENYFLTFQKK
jgi:ubiquinone/menaquinone biosynthesis C-methylase UbiE/protein tyrosine phosphatase (PTP) superfamily phosphohydrolase (DUF442 family)